MGTARVALALQGIVVFCRGQVVLRTSLEPFPDPAEVDVALRFARPPRSPFLEAKGYALVAL